MKPFWWATSNNRGAIKIHTWPPVVHDAIKQILDLYADDTTLQASYLDLSVLEQTLNEDLESLSKWLNENRLVLNTDKTVCMILSTHQCTATLTNCTLNLNVGDKPIKQVNEANLLGIIIDESFTWDKHINKVCNKISKILGLLKRLKKFIPSNTLLMLLNSLMLPHFDYANVVWSNNMWSANKICVWATKKSSKNINRCKKVQLNKTIIWETKLDASNRKNSIPHSCTYL